MKTLLPLALVVALAACSSSAGATTFASFAQSGGLAGTTVTVLVTTTGRVAVDADGDKSSQRLSARSLQRLRRLLAAVAFDRVRPGRSRCADCFVYSVRYRGKRFAYDDSQTSQVPRSARAVVGELQRISRGGR
jgi:hypothetical protein